MPNRYGNVRFFGCSHHAALSAGECRSTIHATPRRTQARLWEGYLPLTQLSKHTVGVLVGQVHTPRAQTRSAPEGISPAAT